MFSKLVFLSLLVILTIYPKTLSAKKPPIQPWSENPRYWSYHGEPVMLIGGSDDDNLFQWPKDKLIPQLDRLAEAGGNVIRNTLSDRQDKGFELYAYRKLEDGKYDLGSWNKEYWKRFERMLKETSKREIMVQIEVWDRFDYSRNNWDGHPYNPKNNINYSNEESGFAESYPNHPGTNRQPFFFTTPKQRNNKIVLKYQQKFVTKMLDIALKYDNVLFCMDNETSGEEEWGRYWATFIKEHAKSKGKTVYVTEMWDDWNLRGKHHKRTFDHPELYDFVDISQNNQNSGEKHWNNFIFVKEYLSVKPRPINTTKTYGADSYHFGSSQDGIERFWQHLIAGTASVRFHRPPAGLGLSDKAVASIRAARKVESLTPFWTINPANSLLLVREKNEAYLSADPGKSYVIYFPHGGAVQLDISATKGNLKFRWIDIDSGEWGEETIISAGGKINLTTPGTGNWVGVAVKE